MEISQAQNQHCLTEREMLFSGSPVEVFWQAYLLPGLVLFGVSGNLINLTVLLAPGMKTRSNLLLASLALADIVFLLSMFPHSLAIYRTFAYSFDFRVWYHQVKMHLMGVANWASAAAIWFVLTVCCERLYAVSYPLRVQRQSPRRMGTTAVIMGVVAVTGSLTFYTHLAYDCPSRVFCNGTQFHFYCLPRNSHTYPGNKTNPHSQLMQDFISWSIKTNAIAVVFIPILIVVVSSVLLVITVKAQRRNFHVFHMDNRSSEMTRHHIRTEQKITATVCAIVCSFAITQAPSAILAVIAGAGQLNGPAWYPPLNLCFNCLTVMGKTMNFLLFCLSSSNFRRRLVQLTKSRINHKSIRRKSMNTSKSSTISSADSLRRSISRRSANGGVVTIRREMKMSLLDANSRNLADQWPKT